MDCSRRIVLFCLRLLRDNTQILLTIGLLDMEDDLTIGYKLTDANHRTYDRCQWGENVCHTTSGDGGLCSSGWLHYYRDPLLAVFHNPIHAAFSRAVLWECKVTGKVLHDGWMKSGTTQLTTVTIRPLPEITTTQWVAYAILCAKLCAISTKEWDTWSDEWLTNIDRSAKAARAAYAAASLAAYAADGTIVPNAWAAVYATNAAAVADDTSLGGEHAVRTRAATAAEFARCFDDLRVPAADAMKY